MGYFQNPPGPSHDNFTASLQSMAIVANGDVHPAISSGQFVYVREHSTLSEGLYKASSSIAQDATLSTSNLTAVSGGGMNSLNEQMANLPEIKNVSYTTTENIQVPANGMKEIGTAATVLGDAARLVLAGLIIANGYEKLILGMNRYGSTVYVVARNIEGTAKTIASGTTITFVTYKG